MEQSNIVNPHQATSLSPEALEAIAEAKEWPSTNGLVPAVYEASLPNGKIHVGINFTLRGTSVGHKQHFDHGFSFERNEDATIIWVGK